MGRYKDTIACNVEMFSTTMTIFVYKHGTIQCFSIDSETAYETVVRLCHEQDIYYVQLSGDRNYLQGFIEDLRQEEELNYSNTGKPIEIGIIPDGKLHKTDVKSEIISEDEL